MIQQTLIRKYIGHFLRSGCLVDFNAFLMMNGVLPEHLHVNLAVGVQHFRTFPLKRDTAFDILQVQETH